MSDTPLVRELRHRMAELERQNADLQRQVAELRAAVEALIGPPPVKNPDTFG